MRKPVGARLAREGVSPDATAPDPRRFTLQFPQLFPRSATRMLPNGSLPTESPCCFTRRCIRNVRWSSR
ncbi:hypothetical protein EMIT0P44_510021 [Pseudomonas sp. IT-P44]